MTNSLENARKEINRIDKEMAKLFEERIGCAKVIAEYKKERGLPILDEQRENEIINIRRDLHRIPELGLKEFKTTQYIKDALEGYDVEIADIGLETGLCVLVRGANPGKTIALRADIDALPLEEASGLDFASEHPGVCHACGHDIHATMALSAARYLSEHRDELYGNVWIYFQPAEETLWMASSLPHF